MDDEPTQRISRTTAAFMIIVAVLIDLAHAGTQLLALLGFTILSGAIGALACQYANIDAEGTCATVAVVAGVVFQFSGIGTAIAAKVGMVMSWLAGQIFTVIGYSIMSFWFMNKGVSLLSGKNSSKRVTTFFVGLIVDAMPFLDVLPGISVWTITMIYYARKEDKEKAEEALVSYNNQKRVTRIQRRYVTAENSY